MECNIGMRLTWTPDYFKWDTAKEVEVTKTYPRGYAALSNGFIVDRHGEAEWHGKIAGRVNERRNDQV